MSINNFNNFNNDSSKPNDNENEDSLNGNSAQISNTESNKNSIPENNDNNLDENKNTEDNTNKNTIHPVNNVDNTQNSSNNNNNNSNSLTSITFIFFQQILLSLLSPPNSSINNSFSSRSHDYPIPNNEVFDDRGFNYLPSYFNDNLDNENDHNSLDDLTFDSPVFNYNYDLRPIDSISNDPFEDIRIDSTIAAIQNSESSEQNHQGNIFLSRKRKRGRLSKELKEQNDGIKRHSREEKGNVIRKMIIAIKKYAHIFIKEFTHVKLYEPTITECIKGSKADIRKFLNLKLLDVYSYHTIPKNFKGVGSLKYIQDPKLKREEKKDLLKEYQISIKNKILEEKDKEKKPLTALLNLTLSDFLNIYLDYGYNGNNNRTIEIDENKYGLKYINLLGLPTYYETKQQFSKKESNQTNYRKSLKNIIAGK